MTPDEWIDGPVPDGTTGLLIVLLDEAQVTQEYYGEPVCVRWWGHKAKSTYGQHTIMPEWVLKWKPVEDVR